MNLRQSYIISLLESDVRRENMLKVLDYAGLKAVFFDAINPRKHPKLAENTADLLSGQFLDKYTAALSPGTFGCSLSHIRLWAYIGRQSFASNDVVLIMEDDVSLSPTFLYQLSQVLNELPEDFDLCFLGGWPADHRFRISQPRQSPTLARMRHFCLTSTAIYLVAPSRLEYLQSTLLPFQDEIDIHISNFRHQLKIYLYAGASACCLTQVGGMSDRGIVDRECT